MLRQRGHPGGNLVAAHPALMHERKALAEHGVVARVTELEAARDLWETWTDLNTEAERFQAGRLTARLVHLADIEAVTVAA